MSGVAEVWCGHVDQNQAMDGSYRPIFLSFWAALGAIFGFSPAVFRVVTLLIHSVNAFLVARLAKNRFRLSEFTAATVALFFLLHPIQVTSIGLVWKQSDLWIALLALLSIEAMDRKPFFAFFLFLIAAGIKENALIFPALWFLMEPMYGRERRRKRLIFVTLGVACALTYHHFLLPILPGGAPSPSNPASRVQYFLTELHVLAMYAKAFVVPVFLSIDRAVPMNPSPSTADSMVLFVSCAGVVVAWIFFWRRKIPELGAALLGVLWLVPTSSFQPLALFYDETRVYLAVASIALLFALALTRLKRRLHLSIRVKYGLLGLGVFALSAASIDQTARWKSDEALWRTALEIDPRSPRANYHVGIAEQKDRALDDAEEHFRAALEFGPNLYQARLSLGTVLGQKGNLTAAREQFEELLKLDPSWQAEGHFNLGLGAFYQKRYAEARLHFEAARDAYGASGLGDKGLAILSAKEGKDNEALQHWEEFLKRKQVPLEAKKRIPKELVHLVREGALR